MPILNYSTKIRPDKTVSEIQKMLGAKGARRVSVDWLEGRVSAVHFVLDIGGRDFEYRLPSNVEGVQSALKRQRVPRTMQTREHAECVAWRILKDWVEAQLALVEAQQAQMAEVFLPYVVIARGMTLFQRFENQAARGLISGDVLDE